MVLIGHRLNYLNAVVKFETADHESVTQSSLTADLVCVTKPVLKLLKSMIIMLHLIYLGSVACPHLVMWRMVEFRLTSWLHQGSVATEPHRGVKCISRTSCSSLNVSNSASLVALGVLQSVIVNREEARGTQVATPHVCAAGNESVAAFFGFTTQV